MENSSNHHMYKCGNRRFNYYQWVKTEVLSCQEYIWKCSVYNYKRIIHFFHFWWKSRELLFIRILITAKCKPVKIFKNTEYICVWSCMSYAFINNKFKFFNQPYQRKFYFLFCNNSYKIVVIERGDQKYTAKKMKKTNFI